IHLLAPRSPPLTDPQKLANGATKLGPTALLPMTLPLTNGSPPQSANGLTGAELPTDTVMISAFARERAVRSPVIVTAQHHRGRIVPPKHNPIVKGKRRVRFSAKTQVSSVNRHVCTGKGRGLVTGHARSRCPLRRQMGVRRRVLVLKSMLFLAVCLL